LPTALPSGPRAAATRLGGSTDRGPLARTATGARMLVGVSVMEEARFDAVPHLLDAVPDLLDAVPHLRKAAGPVTVRPARVAS
jgi:hypothetical protein